MRCGAQKGKRKRKLARGGGAQVGEASVGRGCGSGVAAGRVSSDFSGDCASTGTGASAAATGRRRHRHDVGRGRGERGFSVLPFAAAAAAARPAALAVGCGWPRFIPASRQRLRSAGKALGARPAGRFTVRLVGLIRFRGSGVERAVGTEWWAGEWEPTLRSTNGAGS